MSATNDKKSIVLVTGGNGGIGLEVVSQLLSDPSKHVLLGSRSAENGEAAVKELQSRKLPGTVELLQVDIASEDSIVAAAKKVEREHGRLDALVNNAGIARVEGSLSQQMAVSFQTNATGPLLMVESFAPLLRKSSLTPRIVNVSTSQGLVSKRLDPTEVGYDLNAPHYRGSKAALNMVTACQIVTLGGKKEEGGDGMKVFGFCPGFTVSNLGGFNTAANGARPTSESAKAIVMIVDGKRDAEHGCFLHGDGQYPW